MIASFYFGQIKKLMHEKGIGGIITRKELVRAAENYFNPRSNTKLASPVYNGVDKLLIYLRRTGFLASCGVGKNTILKIIPDGIKDIRTLHTRYINQLV